MKLKKHENVRWYEILRIVRTQLVGTIKVESVDGQVSSIRHSKEAESKQGALQTAFIPRALPWAKSFCPFRACCVNSTVQFEIFFLYYINVFLSLQNLCSKV